RGSRVEDRITSLVRPEDGSLGNAHIHGISADDIAAAPTFAELAERVLAVIDGAILVAHSAAWDVAFLEAELARAARPATFAFYLDPLQLSRRAFALPSHRLAALAEKFGIPHERAHRADADVAALRVVFARVLEVLTPATPRDLWHVRVGQRKARPDVMA